LIVSPTPAYELSALGSDEPASLAGVEGFANRSAHDLGASLLGAGIGVEAAVAAVGAALDADGDGYALIEVAVEIGDEGDGVWEVGVTAVED
jgi:hypothetical protein